MQRAWGSRSGWLVVLLVGCDMLPPPPPPKFRTAPATTATTTPPPADPGRKGPPAPRGPDSAPEHFKVRLETTKGDVVIDVHRHLAPLGTDRFYQLVKEGYYDGCKFFRVVPGFVVQFGMNGDPELNRKYQDNKIPDDKSHESNKRGTVTFATSGANSRTSQLFINLGNNTSLDSQGFAPFGRVVKGMEDVVDKITSEYGEEPQQPVIAQAGNTYLDERFPNLDHIIKATVIEADGKPVEGAGDAKSDAPKTAAPAEEKPAEKSESKPDEEKKADGE